MLIIFAVFLSSASFANPLIGERTNLEPVSEIQQLLEHSDLIIEEEFTVIVIFKVTKDRTIDVQTVKSKNEEVNEFLKKRLQDHKLQGIKWFTQKMYELPVKVQAIK